MLRKLFFFLPALLLCSALLGASEHGNSGLRISLLTCGPGYDAIYEVFGHTAVRIIDSERHTDHVYNYGTFDGFQKNFELKFMRGQVMYYLTVQEFNEFMDEYVNAKRTVNEQLLLINDDQKLNLAAFLDWNALPSNKEYKYDFFYDNCSTRIRDLLPHTLDNKFVYGKTLPDVKHYTFRDIINERFYATLWERFGINILLGSRIDRVMSDKDIMFLPDYLMKGLAGATLNGQPVAAKSELILPGGPAAPVPLNQPFILTLCLCILTITGLSVKKLKLLGKIMSTTLLAVTGLLGCLILVMWFGTSHGGCHDNFNLLWLLPTNLIIAFANPKGNPRYALIGLCFILITILLHVFGIQQLLLLEFSPLLLALAYIYGSIYRNSRIKPIANA